MSRIELNHSLPEIIALLSEGNPGAMSALIQMASAGPEIDPQSAWGPYSGPIALDTHKIYGARIWMLYSDVCGKSVETTLGILRACQLGLLGEEDMNHAIDNRGDGIDVPTLLELVKEELTEFGTK